VLAIDNLSTGCWSNIQHLQSDANFHFSEADIATEVVLDRLTSQADIVIHLAAAVGVQLVVEQSVRTIETNVIGTDLVLKAALRYRRRIMLASTSEVYGKGSQIPFSEGDDVVLGPTSRADGHLGAHHRPTGMLRNHRDGLPRPRGDEDGDEVGSGDW
jgi:UDP-glucose 4-epimerase